SNAMRISEDHYLMSYRLQYPGEHNGANRPVSLCGRWFARWNIATSGDSDPSRRTQCKRPCRFLHSSSRRSRHTTNIATNILTAESLNFAYDFGPRFFLLQHPSSRPYASRDQCLQEANPL